MKKVLAMFIAVMMLVSLSVPAFAAKGSFLISPGQNGAPEIIDYDCTCDGELIITPYKDRNTLSEEYKADFESSYAAIAGATDLTEVNKELIKIAKAKKLATQDLVVSDLFYAHVEGCTVHDHVSTYSMRSNSVKLEHGTYTITLKADTLKKFVALMNYVDGDWQMVEEAKITSEGYLQFTTDNLGAFAIVVHTSAAATGDVFTMVGVSFFAVVAVAMVVVLVKTKKRV